MNIKKGNRKSNIFVKPTLMTVDVINRIIYIDENFYHDSYDMEWHKKRYNNKSVAYCLYDNNEIVGYATMFGIKEELYNKIKNGEYTNDCEFELNMIDNNSNYKYLASIVILEKYQYKGFGFKILDALITNTKANIIAIAVSKDGFSLLGKRMNYLMNIADDVAIFELINEDIL